MMRLLSKLVLTLMLIVAPGLMINAEEPKPFGADFPNLDHFATGEWWNVKPKNQQQTIVDMNVPRDQVVAFALYTHDRGSLKITACLYPLKTDESREARLELKQGDAWKEVATSKILYPGWTAHFRIDNWDNSQNVAYRVRHGAAAMFAGLIRKDPIDKESIVIANMSCNSSRTKGARPEIIENLKYQDPDLLFFAGDQSYHHTEHTSGFLEFGLQFRDIIRDRPTITLPDDHDIGQPNLWGESGKISTIQGNGDGGYQYPVEYVNMVQRAQTWHLPDPYDPTPVERNIGVYYTNLKLGGIDFAILEDRKFKSGPAGKIPKMGPRPDHINDPAYDPQSIDHDKLELLGDRQHQFLKAWTQDWTGAELKVALSQTAFCGAVHMHGGENSRLLADLDCNGWPQHGRNDALKLIRQAWAPHLAGDQHLAVFVKHGIDSPSDGPFAFTSPALVNTIYGRWWHPENELPGKNPVIDSPLPWTGEYKDGLGNHIRMLAYANPSDVKDEKQRGDGYGLVRIHKQKRNMTIECWPRFSNAKEGAKQQFPGWPLTVNFRDNDGREPAGFLKVTTEIQNPVVQVIDESNSEVLYTVRMQGTAHKLPVYNKASTYTIKIGQDKPESLLQQKAIPVND